MKKRDRPLVGDSPARIRVPMVGTVSLGGVVAVANGRCGIPESSPGQAPSCIGHRSHPQPESGRRPVRRVWGWGKRDGSPQGSGRRRQRPRAGRCLVERSAGPSRALNRPVCLTSRQPLLALRQRRATLRSGPRASLRQGPQPPQAALRDDLAGSPAHPQDRRDLKRPAVSGGHQGGGLSRALAVDQDVPVPEPPLHQVRPLGEGPPRLVRLSLLCVRCRRGPPAPRPRPPPA